MITIRIVEGEHRDEKTFQSREEAAAFLASEGATKGLMVLDYGDILRDLALWQTRPFTAAVGGDEDHLPPVLYYVDNPDAVVFCARSCSIG